MSKKSILKIIIAVIVVFGLITLFSSMVITNQNEYKLVRVFGKVDRVIEKEGLSFKIPFIEETDTIPKCVMLYDLATSEVITKDKKTMVADTYVVWKVSDPLKFAKTLSVSITNAESRIDATVYNALKEVIGGLTQTEVISARDEMSKNMMLKIGTTMEQYGIEIVSIDTKHLDLPDDNKEAVYSRMISEREQMAAQYTAEGAAESQIIQNTTDKDVAIMISAAEAQAEQIKAEGEALYMQTLSAAYNDASRSDFYSFVRALDAAKLTMVGDNKTLILPADSPLASIFTNGTD